MSGLAERSPIRQGRSAPLYAVIKCPMGIFLVGNAGGTAENYQFMSLRPKFAAWGGEFFYPFFRNITKQNLINKNQNKWS